MFGVKRIWAKLAVVTAAFLLFAMSAASAATMTVVTYTGTVTTAIDAGGLFGAPGGNLAGAGYKLVFTIDASVGSYSTFNGTIPDPLASGDQIFGGISAALTINGQDLVFPTGGSPNGNFAIAVHKPGAAGIIQQVGAMSYGSVLASLTMTNPDPSFPLSVYAPATITSCPAATCLASLRVFTSFINANLGFGSVTVATTPVPAALPLLVSALGGLGFVGWRRRKQQAA